MKPITQYSQPQAVEDIVTAVEKLLDEDLVMSIQRPDYSRELDTMDNPFVTTFQILDSVGQCVRYARVDNLPDQAGGIRVSFASRYYTSYMDDENESKMDMSETPLRSRTYLPESVLSTITEPKRRVTKRDVVFLPREIAAFLNNGFVPA